MEPFLPVEIPLMVLRYLAASKREATAMMLMDEFPILKDYVNAKPPNQSNSDYLKYLAHCSIAPGLKDILSDYAHSKILAEEITQDVNLVIPSFPNDSLQCKLKVIHELLKSIKPGGSLVPCSTSVNNTTGGPNTSVAILPVKMVEQSTNTVEVDQQRGDSSHKTFAETSCQTEEFTAVQFGLQDDIPRIFYKALLGDNNLQQKIAQTINEHIQDPEGSQPESVVQMIASKTETEIDKFLVDLLQDIPDDGDDIPNDFALPPVNEATGPFSTFADVERSMSLMFGGAETLLENDVGSKSSKPPEGNVSKVQTSTSTCTQSITEMDHDEGDQGQTSLLHSSSSSISENKSPSSSVSTPTTTNEAKTNEESSNTNPAASASTLSAATRRVSGTKRITPTPISSSVNPAPAFKATVVIEKQTVDLGNKTTNVSVIKKDIEESAWKKIGRKSIQPKIPLQKPNSKPSDPIRVITQDRTDKVIDFGGPNRYSETRPRSSNTRKQEEVNSTITVETPVKKISKPDQVPPRSSQKKRKTTPVKLTPEKANNIEYNFMCYFPDNSSCKSTSKSKSGSRQNEKSAMKETPVLPVPITITATDTNVSTVGKEVLQPIVTPIQPPLPVNISDLQTISPSGLRRLIMSASKLGGTSSKIVSYVNKKKSFSTPRKKHVRSLTFTTPPSLKAITTGDGKDQHRSNRSCLSSLKRKATEDLHRSNTDFKSKKRLNWPDSVKKDEQRKGISTPANNSEVINQQAVSTDNKNLSTTQKGSASKALAKQSSPSMPTILEESVSNSSVSVPNPNTNPGSEQSQLGATEFLHLSAPPDELQNMSPGTQVLYSVPVLLPDGTQFLQYYQLATDQKTLIPVSIVEAPQPQEPIPGTASVSSSNGPPTDSLVVQSVTPSRVVPTSAVCSPRLSLAAVPDVASDYQTDVLLTPPPAPPTRVVQQIIDGVESMPSTNQSPLSPLSSAINAVALGEFTSPQRMSPSKVRSLISHDLSLSSTSSESTPNSVPVKPATPKRTLRNRKTQEPVSKAKPSKSTAQSKPRERPTRTKAKAKPAQQKKQKAVVTKKANTKTKEQSKLITSQVNPPSESAAESFQESTANANLNARADRKKTQEKKAKRREAPNPRGRQSYSMQAIFGDTPEKSSPSKTKTDKLPADVIAAQTVAAEAVPLGNLRRSPRKHPLTSSPYQIQTLPERQEVSPIQSQSSQVPVISPVLVTTTPPEGPTNRSPLISPPTTEGHSVQQQQPIEPNIQEHTVTFNIVPAPLGFPEPTPVKNYISFLNLSDHFGLRSPLITPLKSTPPTSGMNESQNPLPPTPRMMEDADSNSNSNLPAFGTFKHGFDGMMSMSLFSSTPLKPGVPRTPGRSAGSSNSQSPVGQVRVHHGVARKDNVPATQLPTTSLPVKPLSVLSVEPTHLTKPMEKQPEQLKNPVEKLPDPPKTLVERKSESLQKSVERMPEPLQKSGGRMPEPFKKSVEPQPQYLKKLVERKSEPPRKQEEQVPKPIQKSVEMHHQSLKKSVEQRSEPPRKPVDRVPETIQKSVEPVPQYLKKLVERKSEPPRKQEEQVREPIQKSVEMHHQSLKKSVERISEPPRKPVDRIPETIQKSVEMHHQSFTKTVERRSASPREPVDGVPETIQKSVEMHPQSLKKIVERRSEPQKKSEEPASKDMPRTQDPEEPPSKQLQRTQYYEEPSSQSTANSKSDGELSSSDEETSSPVPARQMIASKPRAQTPKLLPSRPSPALTIISSSVKENDATSTRKPQLQPKTHLNPPKPKVPDPRLPLSLNANVGSKGIPFYVGGREKMLTFSEEETVISLMKMKSGVNSSRPHEKRENPIRPIGTASVIPQQCTDDQPKLPASAINTALQGKDILKLMNLVRRKKAQGELIS